MSAILLERTRRFDEPVLESDSLYDVGRKVLVLVLTGAERPVCVRSHAGSLRLHCRVASMVTENDVIEALHGVEDPELGMDIVEIGLFYEAEIDGSNVKIIHSLTSMGCPAGQMIQEGIHDAVAALPGVEKVEVELTFDPPWTPDRMSEDAKFILGFG